VSLTVASDGKFEVTNTDDYAPGSSSVPGSLRAAIERANSESGPNTIVFEIPGAGPHVIGLLSGYTLGDVTVVDGTTDADGIVLDGGGGDFACLTLLPGAAGSTINGLTIRNCGQDGILLQQSGGNTITGNTITNNGGSGINIVGDGSSEQNAIATGGNTITGNTITKNGGAGIIITGSANNLIANNNITGNPAARLTSVAMGRPQTTPATTTSAPTLSRTTRRFSALRRRGTRCASWAL